MKFFYDEEYAQAKNYFTRSVEPNSNNLAKICDLFDKWISDEEHHIVISPFMHIIEGLLKPERGIPACHWSKDCSKSFTAIDIHGNLYPCEHWVGMKEYCIRTEK